MDPETRSIHSIAPSYVSDVPSYASSEPPPYTPRAANTRYSSLLPQVNARQPAAASPSSPTSLAYNHRRVNYMPLVSLITPRSPSTGSQSRLYEAVVARRQSHPSNSHLLPSSEQSSDTTAALPFFMHTPRPTKIRSRSKSHSHHAAAPAGALAYSIPAVSENFSSLHPAPDTPSALRHSTAELFLCTCGRDNTHRRPNRLPSLLDIEEGEGGKPLCGTPAASQSQGGVPYGAQGRSSQNEAVEENEGEDEENEEAAIEAEGKQWDFMLSQMADWEEREKRWEEFRGDRSAWDKFLKKTTRSLWKYHDHE